MNKQFIFYKTTYTKDGRFYYGSHYGYLDDNYRGSNKIIKAIKRKSGLEFLQRENLKIFNNKKDMYAFESRFLKFFKLDKNPMCMNFTTNGEGGDTWSHMSESEKAIRKKKLSEKISGSGNGNYGRKFTDEHLKKMSESKIGVPVHSEENKKKISERLKREFEDGTRDRYFLKQFSGNRKGVKLDKDHKKSISIGLKASKKHKEGRLKTAETKRLKLEQRLTKFEKLINEGYSKEYILQELNIKLPTWYKYKRILNEKR